MHLRDTYFEHTVSVDADQDLVNSLGEDHLVEKARDLLEDDVGEAVKWFETSSVDGTNVTFELRVGTAHNDDVDDEAAREKAEEWAATMFDRVDSPFDIGDLEYVRVTDPDAEDEDTTDDEPADGSVGIDNDSDNGNDTATDTEPGEALKRALGTNV